jgi:hypothetical protein
MPGKARAAAAASRTAAPASTRRRASGPNATRTCVARKARLTIWVRATGRASTTTLKAETAPAARRTTALPLDEMPGHMAALAGAGREAAMCRQSPCNGVAATSSHRPALLIARWRSWDLRHGCQDGLRRGRYRIRWLARQQRRREFRRPRTPCLRMSGIASSGRSTRGSDGTGGAFCAR